MRRIIVGIILLGVMFIGLNVTKGYSSDLSLEQSKKMIELGEESLKEKDMASAIMYFRRAVQFNPYNVDAWEKYDELMKLRAKNEPIKWDKIQVNCSGSGQSSSNDPFAEFK